MATIVSQGASATVSLPAGSNIAVTGTGFAVMGPGRLQGTQYGLQGSTRVGPFDTAQTVYLTSTTTALSYTIAPGYVGAGPVQTARNADGTPSGLIDPATGQAVGGGGIDAIKAKFRAGVSRAAAGNFVESDPWFKPPSWSINTSYRNGMVVSSTDGVGQFMQTATIGTSAASGGGPTGSPYALVSDNQCLWIYDGPARGLNTYASYTAPTYADTATVLAAFTNPRSWYPGADNNIGVFAGGYVYDTNTTNSRSTKVRLRNTPSGTDTGGTNSGSQSFTFYTDADKIGFLANENVYAWDNASCIEINDRPVLRGAVVGNPIQLNTGGLVLDLSFWGKGAKKKIKIRTQGASHQIYTVVNRLVTEQSASIWSEAIPSLRWANEGDSLSGGGNGSPYFCGEQWTDIAAALLGIEDYMNNAVGGTGFVKDSSGTQTTYIQRIASLTDYKPDIVTIAGNHNDQNSYAENYAAAVRYFQELRARLQTYTPVIVFGPNILRGESYAPGSPIYSMCELALRDAVAAMNDPYLYFVPNYTSRDPVFEGSGNADAPANNGNADRMFNSADGHPLGRGYRHIGLRNAMAMKSILSV